VTNGADAADAADRTGQWRVRHLAGWRAGIVFNASADLLVAWQSASLTTPARAWTATDRQLGPVLDHVRRTRLDNVANNDVDALDKACRGLIEQAHDHPRAARPVRAILAELERALALADDPTPPSA
jgi:hypothetical protein